MSLTPRQVPGEVTTPRGPRPHEDAMRCRCPCHSSMAVHCVPCCDGGWILPLSIPSPDAQQAMDRLGLLTCICHETVVGKDECPVHGKLRQHETVEEETLRFIRDFKVSLAFSGTKDHSWGDVVLAADLLEKRIKDV